MIVLASASPRRRELLSLLYSEFTVAPEDVDETSDIADPAALVCFLAQKKARAARAKYPDDTIIGADTVVAVDGEILGKPKDRRDAARMIRLLAGRAHEVWTGVAVMRGARESCRACATKVTFAPMAEDEIAEYAAGEDVLDKAGAYAIQGAAAKFITGIEGDFFNVVGLPVRTVYEMAGDLEIPPGEA